MFYLASHTVYRLWDELSLLYIWWFVKCYTIVCVACCLVVCRLSVMVLTFFNLIWRFVKRYTIVCVACSLVVYGLSFIGCGVNFHVKYHKFCKNIIKSDE